MGVFNCFSKEAKMSSIPEDDPVSEKKEKEEEVDERNEGRAQWASPTEFLLTCIGYSVGLGNVWRFPYLCYKSGGGAFLIPYVIMMALIGMPLLFMEYAFGQYFGVGGLTVFKRVCPIFQGIGIGYMVLNGLVCIYYNVIIAMSLYYLFASFTSNLPWGSCGHSWNTEYCGDPGTSVNGTSILTNITAAAAYSANGTLESVNETIARLVAAANETVIRFSPSDEYFRHGLLDVGPEHSINNLGHVRWHLCLCLLLAWVLVVLFVSRGIKSTGKVAYFTATFPYLMLTVLVVRGVTLEGASKGIIYFLKPDWSKLTEPEVWFGAASQLFYSTNLAWGGMITMASYNTFNHNCFRDAIMINFVSFFTSIYAGFAVFSIIGYMANEYNIEVSEVIKSGPGLAFIVYPRALSLMPLAPMWSALFFFMLFLLGVGSQMVLIETVVTGIVDEYPKFGLNPRIRFMTTVCVAVLFLVLGIPCTTQGGMYVLQLMDWYSASFSVLFIAAVECIAINWVYTNSRFAANVKEMLGYLPHWWWRKCWQFVSPIVIVAILGFSFAKYERAKYGSYEYPGWAEFLGWVMVLAAVLPIPIVAFYKWFTADGDDWKEKFQNAARAVDMKTSSSIEEGSTEKIHRENGVDNEKSLLAAADDTKV